MKTNTFRAALVAVCSIAAGAASAGQCGWDYCWGAVGFGPGGAYGYAYSHYSETDAYNAAQDGCGWNCTEVKTFYNTCGAMAVGVNDGWGWG